MHHTRCRIWVTVPHILVVVFVFCCSCSLRSFVKVFLKVVALCRSIAPAIASWSVVVGSCWRYINVSFCSLAFRIEEMRSPSGAWSSTDSKEVGWEVISNASVGTALRSGMIGWVV